MDRERDGFDWDVVVLGGGAAGLVAAIRAAERGGACCSSRRTGGPGVKILMSGGTRCNLTNARGLRSLDVVSGPIDPAYDPRQAHGRAEHPAGVRRRRQVPRPGAQGAERRAARSRSSRPKGVATKVEANGKVFPVSDRATDVLAALLRRLRRSGAALRCRCPGRRSIEADGGAFEVSLPDGTVTARRVIVAVGGQSYPGCGTTGDGYAIARAVRPHDRRAPPRTGADPGRGRLGPRPEGADRPRRRRPSVVDPAGRRLLERREALLFAHFGLTGPAILDVSRAVARHDGPERLDLVLDFAPDVASEALDQQLQAVEPRRAAGRWPACSPRASRAAWPRPCSAASGIPADRIGPDLSRDERQAARRRAQGPAAAGRRHARLRARPRSPAAASRSTRSTPRRSRAGSSPASTSSARSSTSTA